MVCEIFVVFVHFVVRSVPGLHPTTGCALSLLFLPWPWSAAARLGYSFHLFLTPPFTR
jgi:hypothetical protein